MHTLVGAVFLCSVAGFLGEVHQGFELASHFRLQYLLAGLAGLLVCVTLHAWWAALGAGVTVVLNLVLVVPWYLPPARAPLTGPQYPVRILLANVEDANHNVAALIRLVIEEDPQVVILQEATELWLERLKVLQERFPYATALPRPGSVGIALYSRLPVERFDVIPLGSRRIPGLLTRLDGGGGGLSVVTVHPPPAAATRLPPEERTTARHRRAGARVTSAQDPGGRSEHLPLVAVLCASDAAHRPAQCQTRLRPAPDVAGLDAVAVLADPDRSLLGQPGDPGEQHENREAHRLRSPPYRRGPRDPGLATAGVDRVRLRDCRGLVRWRYWVIQQFKR